MIRLPSLADQQRREHEVYSVAEQVIFDKNVRPLVNPEIIDEHQRRPIGHHSDALERVLLYLRRHHNEMTGKYILVCTVPHQEWRVAQITGKAGELPQLTDQKYTDRYEAEHGIFLLRLKDAGLYEDK